MHAKTDSEVTSLALSSPPRSPRRPVYYVQSPSRDSHDGEKTATSFHSTPALSPTASPPRHSHSSVGPHSRDSSSSRFSGSIKPGRGRKIAAAGAVVADEKGAGQGRIKIKEFATIEEEGLLEEEDEQLGLPRRCYYLAFVLGFAVLFSFFALILWGASRSQKPRVTMKVPFPFPFPFPFRSSFCITFENFIIQAGTDASLVPTDMSTLNSTVSFAFRNTGTFFGVHVSATSLQLDYSQLTVATGDMKNFYQSRKSQRNVVTVVEGTKVPLYGGGPILSGASGKPNQPNRIPLTLSFVIKAKAYVLGQLVKPRFHVGVECQVSLDPAKLGSPVSLKNSCQYN
ncbi:hypothetical protein ZIOFF_043025 [Zingiber officinale]|uniref:Late embryogenesis abundant protein LEA-2 subgroup domain-containing protein n=1 Tax=Zingiber officinale TaxID=94328 RepID=A0A8J5FVT9_ZINOF|nr:hypothetical protein ZIOFF_043025 [Zingiber officinale]